MKKLQEFLPTVALAITLGTNTAYASSVIFDNGTPDGLMGSLSRPSTGGVLQTESADDFILSNSTSITGATFTGLVTGASPTIASATTQSLTTRDFPKVSGIVRLIWLISIPVPRSESLWRGKLRDVGENPAKVSV